MLDEDVEHGSVLIYGPLQRAPFAVDDEKHPSHIPLVLWLGCQYRS